MSQEAEVESSLHHYFWCFGEEGALAVGSNRVTNNAIKVALGIPFLHNITSLLT